MERQNLLFTPIEIDGIQLKNRLMRSATYEHMATEEGKVTDRLINFYTRLAKGGVGLIVLGYAYVQENGHSAPCQIGIFSDDHIPGLKRLADEVHKLDTKVAMQIAHAGRQTVPGLIGGQTPMAPSAIEPDPVYDVAPREMSKDEIYETVASFGEAARRVKEVGFNAVQLHAAHGYLLAQFLSPHTNRRSDDWGGTPENRMRFVTEVYKRVREAVGKDYPVLIKLSVDEGLKNGIKVGEAGKVAGKLSQLGIAAIEISGGTIADTVFMMSRGDIPIDLMTRDVDPEAKVQMEDLLYANKDMATIQRCLAKAPEDRYESTGDLAKDLKVIQSLSAAPIPSTRSQSSIAVLPFANMSTDPEQEYFCDGMAEEIINALTQRRYMERLRPV